MAMIKIPYGKGIEIYNKSPLWLKDIFAMCTSPIPRSSMVGQGFHNFFRELDKTQWLKPDELKKYQEKRLRALIKHAYFNVPYYHRIFKENNIDYEDIKSIEDLKKIPLLTKDDIRNHYFELIAVNASDYKYGVGHTSGSTGKPLSFLLDQQNREIEYAAVWRQLKWAGIGINAKVATFRGDLVQETGESSVLWKNNALSKELVFNTYQLNDDKIANIINKLNTFKPALIKGFPSSLYVLALYIRDKNIDFIRPSAVQTSSEFFSTSQRKIIEDSFGCKVFDWYGHSEYAVSAGECEFHEGLHINVESGVVEFLKSGGQVSEGELGEIVATGLYNYSMPLIRYKTSDLSSYSSEKCSCGRFLPLMNFLEGRVSDVIISVDDKVISGAAFEHYWKHRISPLIPNVEYVHVIQKTKTKLLIEMVKSRNYSEKENEAILFELSHLLGSSIKIDFKDLSEIPTGNKWRFTTSEISGISFNGTECNI